MPFPFRAVLFDFDGTLADSYPAITSSVNHIRASYGLAPLTSDQVRPIVGHGPVYLLVNTVPGVEVESDLPRFRAHHEKIMRQETRLMPGAAEVISALRQRGLKLGVCSNKPKPFTLALLEHFGLLPHFDIVVGPEDVARPKPAPDMLRHALRMLDVPTGEAVYIGDMRIDIQTARAAGTTAWVVPTGSDSPEDLLAAQPDRMLGSRQDAGLTDSWSVRPPTACP